MKKVPFDHWRGKRRGTHFRTPKRVSKNTLSWTHPIPSLAQQRLGFSSFSSVKTLTLIFGSLERKSERQRQRERERRRRWRERRFNSVLLRKRVFLPFLFFFFFGLVLVLRLLWLFYFWVLDYFFKIKN